MMIHCSTCGETRRTVTLWRQIMSSLHPDAVCCWPNRTEES